MFFGNSRAAELGNEGPSATNLSNGGRRRILNESEDRRSGALAIDLDRQSGATLETGINVVASSRNRTDSRPTDQNANADLFDQLIEQESPKVRALVQRLLPGHHDHDDLVQEVFVQAWLGWSKFRNQSRVGTWLCGIAVNLCRNLKRRQRLWQLAQIRLFRPIDDERGAEGLKRVSDQDLLKQALEKLSHRDREIIVLKWIEQFSTAEICEVLQIGNKAAEARLARSQRHLREILEQLEGGYVG